MFGWLLLEVLKFSGGVAAGVLIRDAAVKKHTQRVKATKRKGAPVTGSSSSKKTGPAEKRGRVLGNLIKLQEELKMVLLVNESLHMGKGKIGAQCGHAVLGLAQRYYTEQQSAYRQWEQCGSAKIALKVQDDSEMAELEQKASAAGIGTYIVFDAGRTQIPAGSQTVLAIGPAPKSVIDSITGHLRLL